jgi:hypothetical protein
MPQNEKTGPRLAFAALRLPPGAKQRAIAEDEPCRPHSDGYAACVNNVTSQPRCQSSRAAEQPGGLMLGTILLIVLILLLIGMLRGWSLSRPWGYAPSGEVGFVVVVVLILMLTGQV